MQKGNHKMFGTIVNALAILTGSVIGMLLRGGLKDQYRSILEQAMALSVLFVGISGAISGLLDASSNPVLYIISLAIGGLLGEWLRIEARLQQFGDYLQLKCKTGGNESNLSEGFVTASLLFCVGTMAVLGSIQSGTQGTHTILLTKSLIDGITALVIGSTLGLGVAFSCVSVLVYQTLLTLLAQWISPILNASVLLEIGIIGGVMITVIGLNMLKLTKIRVGNFLPALLIPIVYFGMRNLLHG